MASPVLFQRFRQWLFRLSPERGEVVLQQRRIFILPTRTGLLYAMALQVMLLGAVNYDLALGHALVFLLAGLGLVAMIHTFRNLVGLGLACGAVEPVFAGDQARLPLHLRHQRQEARRALEISSGAGDGNSASTDLAPAGSASLALPLPARPRGRHPLPRLTVASVYPLGLFRAWAYFLPEQSHLVYPAPRTTPLPASRAAPDDGDSRGETGQEDFVGLRPRQPADPLRHIAWKAAAREQGQRPLPVKHFAGGAALQTWLDWQEVPPDADREAALSILTGWVLAAEAAGLAYGLVLPGKTIPPERGPDHRHRCLETLALWPPLPAEAS
ncbi:MAG TPA: DUF58 domain-containing protein [Azospira sp.]|nr:DUF58 domain-containing protein [Azospira sp.]